MEYKKVVVILVFNDKQELVLQLRAAHDDTFPSYWDLSVGGSVDPGEEPGLSAKRELQEELGVEASIEFIGEKHYTYPAWKPNVMREVDMFAYKAHHNGPFSPDPKEVEKIEFADLETIQSMMDNGQKFHPEFMLLWKEGVMAQAVQG